jgi:bacterioferritin
MRELDVEKTVKLLNGILEQELAGVVRYTHYALMVSGPNRIPIVEFMKGQASESLVHAQQVGEILTGLGGHPSLSVAPLEETFKHSLRDILSECLNHEKRAVKLYVELLDTVANASIYIEEFARTMIGQEEFHQLELKKMLRDFSEPSA